MDQVHVLEWILITYIYIWVHWEQIESLHVSSCFDSLFSFCEVLYRKLCELLVSKYSGTHSQPNPHGPEVSLSIITVLISSIRIQQTL